MSVSHHIPFTLPCLSVVVSKEDFLCMFKYEERFSPTLIYVTMMYRFLTWPKWPKLCWERQENTWKKGHVLDPSSLSVIFVAALLRLAGLLVESQRSQKSFALRNVMRVSIMWRVSLRSKEALWPQEPDFCGCSLFSNHCHVCVFCMLLLLGSLSLS